MVSPGAAQRRQWRQGNPVALVASMRRRVLALSSRPVRRKRSAVSVSIGMQRNAVMGFLLCGETVEEWGGHGPPVVAPAPASLLDLAVVLEGNAREFAASRLGHQPDQHVGGGFVGQALLVDVGDAVALRIAA